ncbi:MAG TPA: phosphoribosylanthranilate isomerase [Candidatus Limiplasma sp.]|nr:phosphoribosylanthranilate isomerase [Candidatus Limiplasma sp.]HRX08112.1 phosphoribosylanthranilate isomerase [Candidatus Limiplasma sp.]
MNGVQIKICGLFRPEDAQAVNAAMPDYAGFVFYEKSKRNVSPALAGELRAAMDATIRTVGVFVGAPVAQIAALYQNQTISVAQLHGIEDDLTVAALRKAAPGMEIWQAFKVRTEADLLRAEQSRADQVLLDGGAGEGKPFDWRLADAFPRPFILAGGLTPDTIPCAIQTLHPMMVDLSTGVETDGVKDPDKILAAVRAVQTTNAK